MDIPTNACIRTDPRWDKAVRHLGYEPVDILPENAGSLRTDADLISESQEKLARVKIVPDAQLTPRQMATLSLIREINHRNARVRDIHAAEIPPASDRVRTAGMYGRHDQNVYISTDQLEAGSQAVSTCIHEMSHHQTGKGDGEERHEEVIGSMAAAIVDQVSRGDYDQYLKNPEFVW